ncbi:hypothetical protein ACLOJK_028216 [Asimina triloba]
MALFTSPLFLLPSIVSTSAYAAALPSIHRTISRRRFRMASTGISHSGANGGAAGKESPPTTSEYSTAAPDSHAASASASSSSSSAIDFLSLCHRLKARFYFLHPYLCHSVIWAMPFGDRSSDGWRDTLRRARLSNTTKRTGWVRRQVQDPESIADHMYRMGVMALIAADIPGVDRDSKHLDISEANITEASILTSLKQTPLKQAMEEKHMPLRRNVQASISSSSVTLTALLLVIGERLPLSDDYGLSIFGNDWPSIVPLISVSKAKLEGEPKKKRKAKVVVSEVLSWRQKKAIDNEEDFFLAKVTWPETKSERLALQTEGPSG